MTAATVQVRNKLPQLAFAFLFGMPWGFIRAEYLAARIRDAIPG